MAELIKQLILPASLQGEIIAKPSDKERIIAHNDRIVNIKILETATFALPAFLGAGVLAFSKESVEIMPTVKAFALVLMCAISTFATLTTAQIVDICFFYARFETSKHPLR
ncbi:hypothetical protein HZB78_02255 [Candidatus Collierbacteria bacterium]|nr:hypothetical protein [Candidatus Collierbacteria bacterium]